MLGRLYLSFYLVPLLLCAALVYPPFIEKQNAKSECVQEMIRHPTTSKCTF